ncbi:hypothetical protein AKJ09_07035 [Labilithrix luteola]|uniref:Lipoprotein n=1 Tax=Labilithrix luteola TaxID=1391654 RepID=A0A0K1Q405_9BACT|nr:hypothetical protein [Labilithrix luteola]AKV00372.1 hypothetical protein AKJ09_07035 [Labilithrix luteola]
MNTKKRLALLPEVLPAPQKVTTVSSSVRNRAMARLKVLAALSAVGVAAACGGKSEGTGSGGGSGGVDGGLPNDGGDNGPDAYGVVDPLPEPACFPSAQLEATAHYLDPSDAGAFDAGAWDAGARRIVVVEVVWNQSGVVLGEPYSSYGIELLEASSSATGATLVVSVPPPGGPPQVSTFLSLSCYRGPSGVSIALTLSDSDVQVTVTEPNH